MKCLHLTKVVGIISATVMKGLFFVGLQYLCIFILKKHNGSHKIPLILNDPQKLHTKRFIWSICTVQCAPWQVYTGTVVR